MNIKFSSTCKYYVSVKDKKTKEEVLTLPFGEKFYKGYDEARKAICEYNEKLTEKKYLYEIYVIKPPILLTTAVDTYEVNGKSDLILYHEEDSIS